MAKQQKKAKPKLPKKIDVHYIKTHDYRSFHVDGVFGGLTPNGKLYMEFFIQRSTTPQVVNYEITKEGVLGKELGRTGKEGIVRQIEAGFVMDLDIARVMRDWLDSKILIYEKAEKSILEPVKETKK